MKNIALAILFFLLVDSFSLRAQVEKVIVETYYVSDSTDATDTTGGFLETGSRTYRIYIDMAPGYRLRKIYGDARHAFKISSTAVFFNNKADGQTFGKDFAKNRYGENTVALDSWLTLGQTTRAASKTYFGALKSLDDDGSFIGGANNDGGSAIISTGLLTNDDPSAGIPLTTSDGMDTMTMLPSSWGNNGIIDSISGVDSTIFGSAKADSVFISYNAGLQNSGVAGVNPDSNQVLVAQLTTRGEISFELNIILVDSGGNEIRYVASGHDTSYTLSGQPQVIEKLCPYLKYPPVCGCTDPNFLEYSPVYACSNPSACHTTIVFGCMDTMACNYSPMANFNIQSLCCYPGHCNDRNISVVCPQLKSGRYVNSSFTLYPNPADDQVTLQCEVPDNSKTYIEVYDALGRTVFKKEFGVLSGYLIQHLDISGLQKGMYLFRFNAGDETISRTFIKN